MDNVRNYAMNALAPLFGGDVRAANAYYRDKVQPTAEFLPGVGDVMAAGEAVDEFGQGNYGMGTLLAAGAAAGLVPGVGDAVQKGVKNVAQNLPNIRSQKKFKTDEGQWEVFDIEPDENKVRGRPSMFTVLKSKDGYVVRNAYLPQEMQKQGIGSSFYQRMNAESVAKTGKPLRSSPPRTLMTGETITELSPEGVALWESLVRKGLAKKTGEKQYIFVNGSSK
jgi:hypothetical protein